MIQIIRKPTDTPDDNSTAQVVSALERKGASYKFLDLEMINPFSHYIEGELIWVCGLRQDDLQFEMLGALAACNLVVNSPEAIAACASKAQTTSLLVHNNVPTPETLFTASRDIAASFLEKHGRLVYKPLYGFDGNGIFPFTGMEELGAGPWYLQEFVRNDHDFRVFVINGRAVGAIKRSSDSFAHNIHQGGSGRAVEVTPEMGEVASAAASAVSIDYCGVDLLEKDGGFTVLEVNGTPNWHCMSAPIPDLLADHLIETEKEYLRR